MSEHVPNLDKNNNSKEPSTLVTIASVGALGLILTGFGYAAWDQTASYNRLRAVEIGCEGKKIYDVSPQDSYTKVRKLIINQIAEETGITPLEQQIDNSLVMPSGEYALASSITSLDSPLNTSYVVGPTKCADPSTTLADFTGTKQRS